MSLFISFYINRNSKRNYLSFIITYVKLSLFYLRLKLLLLFFYEGCYFFVFESCYFFVYTFYYFFIDKYCYFLIDLNSYRQMKDISKTVFGLYYNTML